MPKKKKTREEKIRASHRIENLATYSINPTALISTPKRTNKSSIYLENDLKFFRSDLTKTFIVSMLVVALELALWLFINRH